MYIYKYVTYMYISEVLVQVSQRHYNTMKGTWSASLHARNATHLMNIAAGGGRMEKTGIDVSGKILGDVFRTHLNEADGGEGRETMEGGFCDYGR